MTTQSQEQERLLSQKNSRRRRLSWPQRLWQRLETIFEMPPPELSTLPEVLIARLGIPSWLLAVLAIGASLYFIFLIAAYFEGVIPIITREQRWWNMLLLPVTGTYLLLIQPIVRNRLKLTIETYRSLIPFNDRLRRLEISAYRLNRRAEVLALLTGTFLGWFVLEPPSQRQYYSVALYDVLGDILVYGFTGWHIYAVLYRSRLLSTIHDQVHNLTVFQQTVPYRALLKWSGANVLVLVGGIFVSAIFLSPENYLEYNTLIIYATLLFAALLVLVFSRVPASLLHQFRVFRAFFLFVLVAIIGTIGYNQFEGWKPEDALYATIITMTTIGYGDYSPVTMNGRIFTILLSLFAIGIGGYAVTSVASFAIEGNFRRFFRGGRVDKKIVNMHDHYVVCGTGRLGRQLAIEFYKSQVPFVVIEKSPEVLEELRNEVDIPYVQGDATHDEALHLAGVDRAKGLVAALSDDKDNVFITLSARAINPSLNIISRVTVEKNRQKLEKAGANQVISPNAVSGRRMASEMLYSEVVTLLDEMLQAEQETGQTLRLEEVHVDQIKIPALAERLDRGELRIIDIGQRTELMVVAVKRCDCAVGEDPYVYTPRGTTALHRGDILIVLGTPEQRLKLQHHVLSPNSFEYWLSGLRG